VANKGICFVITPIGDRNTDIRVRSDQMLRHVYEPVARERCGYEVIRADQIPKPGLITSQVIQHLIEDPMVIADLTGWNPNVFYELALRHVVKKPIVQLIQTGEPIPFDVAGNRTIQVEYKDLDSVDECKRELEKQIHAVEEDPTLVDNPISFSIDLKSAKSSARQARG
jgi:hypothetical protein